MSGQGYYRWRKEYGGLRPDQARRTLRVARRINSLGVIEALADAMLIHGVPSRSDPMVGCRRS